MFVEYFRMREQPFGVTPDPRFLYLSAMHKEALASLYYGLQSARGFCGLVAKPGMGKTTLLVQLLQRMPAKTAFLFQTQCDRHEFMRLLMGELGCDSSETDFVRLHEQFNDVLVRQAQENRPVVIVVDEAQNLEEPVLEAIRLLSDFETPHAKLMQIVLAGQPALADKLNSPSLKQLRQRISIISKLEPFGCEDVQRYIDHRLRVAGYHGAPLFTPDALAVITDFSEGIPRNISNMCFHALSLACAESRVAVDAAIVEEVIADLELESSSGEINRGSNKAENTHDRSWTNVPADIPTAPQGGPAFVADDVNDGAFISADQEPIAELHSAALTAGSVGPCSSTAEFQELLQYPPLRSAMEDWSEAAAPRSVGGSACRPVVQEPEWPQPPSQTVGHEALRSGAQNSPREAIPPTESHGHGAFVPAAADVAKDCVPAQFAADLSKTSDELAGAFEVRSKVGMKPREIPRPEYDRTGYSHAYPEQGSAGQIDSATSYGAAAQAKDYAAVAQANWAESQASAPAVSVPPPRPVAVHDGRIRGAERSRARSADWRWLIMLVLLGLVAASGAAIYRRLTDGASNGRPSSTVGEQPTTSEALAPVVSPEQHKSSRASQVAQPSAGRSGKAHTGSVDADATRVSLNFPVGDASDRTSATGHFTHDLRPPNHVTVSFGSRGYSNTADNSVRLTGGKLIYKTAPDYPTAARDAGIEGEVVLGCVVAETGRVADARVVSGNQLLAQSALAAVKHWRYEPWYYNGRPTTVETTVVIRYTLQ